jgi:hypothetical protein
MAATTSKVDPLHPHRQLMHALKVLPEVSLVAHKHGLVIEAIPNFTTAKPDKFRIAIKWSSRTLIEWTPVSRVARVKGREIVNGLRLAEVVELAIRKKSSMLTPDW